MELILIIILLILLFGGGFGYYRGGYHGRGPGYNLGVRSPPGNRARGSAAWRPLRQSLARAPCCNGPAKMSSFISARSNARA
jgi:hypothetical protein